MIYSLSAGLITAIFIVIVLTLTELLSTVAGLVGTFKINIFAALIIALIFNPIRNRIQMIVDKVFYKKTYDFYATVRKVSHELATKLNLQEIYDFIGETIYSTLGLRNIYLLSAFPIGGYYDLVYKKTFSGKKRKHDPDDHTEPEDYDESINDNGSKPAESIKHEEVRTLINDDSLLIRFFKNSKETVIKDELEFKEQILGKELLDQLKRELKSFNGEAVVPVSIDGELTLLMILGEKLSGEIFTSEDLNLLNIISDQLAIAIKNAKLYKEKVSSEQLASIGMMSATFAHEIRNPMTSLKTFAQLMPEKYVDAEFRNHFSKIVINDIERIDTLIKDYLDFTSQEKSSGFRLINITEVIDQAVEYVNNKLGNDMSSITIEKEYSSNEIYILGDWKKLKQVFSNIITNGCQAIGSEGKIKVNIRETDKFVDISVADNGVGIDIKDLSNIFDPFFTTKEMGVGLGLAISKRIIEAHEGKIKVESKLSEGTTFTVSLPLHNKEESAIGTISVSEQ
jgi:signal transduction histidine kinase